MSKGQLFGFKGRRVGKRYPTFIYLSFCQNSQIFIHTPSLLSIVHSPILRNVIIKDEPVSCPFCLGQCRTQICCKAQENADNNETSSSTTSIVLAIVLFVLLLLLLIVGALIFHFKSWKNLKLSVKARWAKVKKLACCCKSKSNKGNKSKGNKGRVGQRGARVGNIGPVRNVWDTVFFIFIKDYIKSMPFYFHHQHQLGSDYSIRISLSAVHHQLSKLRIIDAPISIQVRPVDNLLVINWSSWTELYWIVGRLKSPSRSRSAPLIISKW